MTLKITPTDDPTAPLVLRLEGRITDDTVAELRTSCAAALAAGRPVVLHLSGVTYADPAGADALRAAERSGCVLTGCSDFLATLLRGVAPAVRGDATNPVLDPEEARLVQALRAGDACAFEAVVRRQSGPMLAAARRILASEDDARDAVQEAFVSAWRGIAGFDGAARLSTWLHRIVVNAALMKLRSRRRRPEESIDDLLPCFDENGAWASGTAQQPSSAEVLVASRETRGLRRYGRDRRDDRCALTLRCAPKLRDVRAQ